MIGINDIWLQSDHLKQNDFQVLTDEYETILRELVSQTRPTLQGLVLMAPFIIENNRSNQMCIHVEQYGEIVRQIAQQHGAIFVDTQAAFNRVLEHEPASALTWDSIHPNHIGHMIVARAWLEAINFHW